MLSLIALCVVGGLALLIGAAVAVPVMIVGGIVWLVLLPLRLIGHALGLLLGPICSLIWWLCGILLPIVVVGAVILTIGVAMGGSLPGLAGVAGPAVLIVAGLWIGFRALNPRAHTA